MPIKEHYKQVLPGFLPEKYPESTCFLGLFPIQ